MRRPTIPWLERESTNRDAVVLMLAGAAVSVLLGVLDVADVLKTMPLGAWLGVGAFALLLPLAYRRGADARAGEVPRHVDRYAGHVKDTLHTLHLALTGEIPSLRVSEFVQEAVFEPAAAILARPERGELRFSVLVPADDAPAEFSMICALGHSPEARRKFRLKILGSFAGLAYGDGRPHWSNNTEEDDRFTPHPAARPGREYLSVVAAPVPRSTQTEGVLVVVAQNADAFAKLEVTYVAQLAEIVGLARAIGDAVSPAEAT